DYYCYSGNDNNGVF
nr:immunoglobulin light chain junction region [Macaca mulatta]